MNIIAAIEACLAGSERTGHIDAGDAVELLGKAHDELRDLLAALQLIRDMDATPRLTDRKRVAEMSRIAAAAIAKATGEQS